MPGTDDTISTQVNIGADASQFDQTMRGIVDRMGNVDRSLQASLNAPG
jgi:hypothetical protein